VVRPQVDLASTAVLVGAILGQLTFGYVGDCLGRPVALQLTMALSILGALISAFAVPLSDDDASIFDFLAVTRFFLGIGVGGVYPLSATIASESAQSKSRGTMTSIVFSMQGVANLLSPVLAMLLLAICGKPDVGSLGSNTGWSWRLLLGIGALPGILLIPFKATSSSAAPTQEDMEAALVASPQAPEGVSGSMSPNKPNVPKQLSFFEALGKREYWGKIVGTAGGWFLFDITFYGNSLFQSTVLREVFKVPKARSGAPTTITGGISENLIAQMAVVAAISLPGYYVSVFLMDRLGRKFIQLQGFFFMAVVFAALGIFVHELEDVPALMLILYGLTFFFSNFGPNTTTFILPAETFPTHMRSTMNGFSAAMGKVGATLGSSAFKPLDTATSLGFTMVACALVSLLGLVITYLFVEDRLGEGMEGEDAAGGETEESSKNDRDRYQNLSQNPSRPAPR
jgi:PHS family inorganic phosphate transporter-like MFS transporter